MVIKLNGIFRETKKAIYRSPLLEPLADIYSKYYLRYKFNACKIKHKLNILTPELNVFWLSTYNCNFRCKHCEASAGEKKVSELTTEEICGVITELSEMGVKKIYVGGGEPLVRKDVFEVIQHINDVGMEYGLTSNGYLVNRYKEKFVNMKPFLYFTSIDGLEATNDEIREKKGAFRETLQALEFFKSIGVGFRSVNTVVLPDNIEELPELKKVIMNSAANFWRFAIPIPVGRAKDNEKMSLTKQQIKYLFDFVEDTRKEFDVEITEDAGYLGCRAMKLRQRPFFCGAGFTRCSIMPDGEVFGCQISYDNKYSEGNIRNKSFKEMWQNGFSRFRNPQLDKDLDKECLNCKHLSSCRGGCHGMRLGNRHCYKEIWEEK